MDWNALSGAQERLAIARRFVDLVPTLGVTRRAAARASDGAPWTAWFPAGLTELLWFVSEVSDASMANAFAASSARDIAAVIDERFNQNADLKPFVFRVMLYDALHVWQALRRMQRTARLMVACVVGNPKVGRVRLTALNLAYTAVVFVWLCDRTPSNRRTQRVTRTAMALLGL